MATSSNAQVQIELGQTQSGAFAAMTDSGDHIVHTLSGWTVWSGKSGYAPDIRPNGMYSGRLVLSTHASNDTVTVAAFSAYSKGVLQSVSATTATIARPSTAAKAQIVSVTMASDGSIATVEGTISATTALSETRNSAGGPPYVPADSVEIGQIRTTSSTAAVIASTEIFQVVGTHAERYDSPVWDVNNLGEGLAANVAAKENAYISLASALPAIHTGGAYKQIYAQVYEPVFSALQKALDFKPADNSPSVSSTSYYGGAVGSVETSINAGGFTAYLSDGVTDALIREKSELLTVKFFPDRTKDPHVLTQGTLGLERTFPVAAQNQAVVTIAAENVSADFTS